MFRSGFPLWGRALYTWLPFHTHYKRFMIENQGEERVVCTTVLMDEERLVFSTCVDVSYWFNRSAHRRLKMFYRASSIH